jgi:hypothetical protein
MKWVIGMGDVGWLAANASRPEVFPGEPIGIAQMRAWEICRISGN